MKLIKTMIGKGMLLTALLTAFFCLTGLDKRNVYYIDENGVEKSRADSYSFSDELKEAKLKYGGYSGDYIIDPRGGWLFVEGSVDVDKQFYLYYDKGVNIILTDGSSLNCKNDGQIYDGFSDLPSLTIYGQKDGTGSFNASGTSLDSAVIRVKNLTINGGQLFVQDSREWNAISFTDTLKINGGCLKTIGGIWGDGVSSNIILNGGKLDLSDYKVRITGCHVTVADGLTYKDRSGNTYSGELSPEEINSLNGKIISPVLAVEYNPPVPERVPVTPPEQGYASSQDNFAAITPGASNGIGGNIKDLTLDFSEVIKSGVDPSGLKMTVVNGSKLTTAMKVKDRSSFTTTDGVKAKYNKKDGTVTFTCKRSGSATVTMEDGNTYTIDITVEKPEAREDAKRIAKGSASVEKTVTDLFGTHIDAGKLSIIKQKHSLASVSDNSIIIDPREKDRIRIRYQYLNKKYKITVKIK